MLITINTLKNYLNISESAHDTLLTDLVEQVSSEIESYCGQPIESAEKVHKFCGSGGNMYMFPFKSVQSISKLEYRADMSLFEAGWADIATANYALEQLESKVYVLLYPLLYNRGTMNYRATIEAGFANVPPEIEGVATKMAAIYYKESTVAENLLGIASLGQNMDGQAATTTYRDMSKMFTKILDRYKVRSIT